MTRTVWPRAKAAILTTGGLLAAFTVAACGSSGQAARSDQTSSAAATSSAATTSSAAGSSSPESAGSQNANGDGSYLGHASNGIVYVVWTKTASGLVGTLYSDLTQQGSGQESVDPESSTLTGTTNGSNLTLSLAGGTNITGTLNGSSLLLNYPGQNGAVIELSMRQASTGDYDRALSALQSEVASANSATRQQQAEAATAQQVQQEATSVSNDLAQLNQDAQQGASGDESSLYTSDLQHERQDVGQTQQDMRHVLNEPGSINVCGDAGTVDGDEGTVEGDVGTIQGDQGTAQGATAPIDNDISQLTQDEAKLQQDSANYPADIPGGTPSASTVQAAIASAKNIEGKINRASAAALSSAQQMLQQAKGYQQQADAACNTSNG
jgi:hypothetical protein